MDNKQGTSDITQLKQLMPGDVIEVVRTLRRLRTMLDTTGFTLYAGFANLGGAPIEAAAEQARLSAEQAATDVHELLMALQKTDNYERLRREALAHIKAAKAAGGQPKDNDDE